jgi:hypothetical protein
MANPTMDAPSCTICGKMATRQCIDGDWWPPCEHARTHGIDTLRYTDPPRAAGRETDHRNCAHEWRADGAISDTFATYPMERCARCGSTRVLDTLPTPNSSREAGAGEVETADNNDETFVRRVVDAVAMVCPETETWCRIASVGNGWACMDCERPMERVSEAGLIAAVRALHHRESAIPPAGRREAEDTRLRELDELLTVCNLPDVEALKLYIAAGEQDGIRLDWLTSEGHSLVHYGAGNWQVPYDTWPVKPSPREAIDGAIEVESREAHADPSSTPVAADAREKP